MNAFRELLTPEDERLASSSIKYATDKIALPAGMWVLVGSRAIGSARDGSDIDLLFLSRHLQKFQRLNAVKGSARISVCAAPISFLYEDAYGGKYGGYFAAKLLNPWVSLKGGGELYPYISSAPFLYFYPFIQFLSKEYRLVLSSESMTALAFIILINICPEFDIYFLRLFTSQNFSRIWELLHKQFTDAAAMSGCRVQDGHLIPSQATIDISALSTYTDFHRERTARASRHWSFGTFTHGGDYRYYENYKTFSEHQIAARGGVAGQEYKAMEAFLLGKSSLPHLFL